LNNKESKLTKDIFTLDLDTSTSKRLLVHDVNMSIRVEK
jgi:hypothetical protein